MKDSGIEWLGEIPEYWSATAVKHNYHIQLGKMLNNRPHSRDDIEVPYLKAQHVQWFSVNTSSPPRMWVSPQDIEQFGVVSGDLLVCEGGEGDRSGIVQKIPHGFIIQNALHRVRSRDNCLNTYLLYVMRSVSMAGWLNAINNQATIAHFTQEKFGTLRMPLPPPPDQVAITAFLDRETTKIDSLTTKIEKSIELLREKRSALVMAAITGKIDVREEET